MKIIYLIIMKKNGNNIINNHLYNFPLNLNNFKVTSKNKIQPININSSNYTKNKIRKIETKPKIKNNINFNTISSHNAPYQHILDELMKYLEVKIKPTLYMEVNNYLNSKIKDYYLDNIDKKYAKKIKVDLNQDKRRKKNKEINMLSSKKHKSYLNFNISYKTRHNLNKNNYIYTPIHNYNQSNSVQKGRVNNKNLLPKLLVSSDYLQEKINYLGKRKKHYLASNNFQIQLSQNSFEDYFKGSSEYIKNFSFEKKQKKMNDFNNEINAINILKKLKTIQKGNLKIINRNKEKIKYKDNEEKFINGKVNNQNKSKSKEKRIKNNGKLRLNLNISSHNRTFNINNKINKLKNTITNNSYIKNEYLNNNTNNNLQNKNKTIIVNLTQRPFMNNKNILNKKLMNKLKISMNKNDNIANSIEDKIKKPYNLKKYEIFSKLTKNNNKGFLNKNFNKINFFNIKKAKSYRLDNSRINNTTNLSINQKSKEKNNKDNNINKKLDKDNFLKIVNNITNKKNINDKKYIHIDSIEINNIIKSNEKEETKKENINMDSKNGCLKYQNCNITNEELMKKIKNSLDDNLKVMLNFSYENFLSKESERE